MMLLKTQLVHIKITRNLQLQNNCRISQRRKNHTNSYNQIVCSIEFITFPFISSKEIFIALSFQLRKSFITVHVNIRIEFFFSQSGHTETFGTRTIEFQPSFYLIFSKALFFKFCFSS